MYNIENNIKEDIYKCTKCGLCQSVCPIYIATKNEMYLSRGRYIVLNKLISSNENIDKNFIRDLDICLNCNKCKNFCPSNIDSTEIFTYLKYKNNYKFGIISFNKYFKLLLIFMSIMKFIYRYFPIKSIYINSIIDEIFSVKVKRKKIKIEENKGNVVYFQGCINKYINPSDKNATLNLLEGLGYRVTKISDNCCGMPLLSDGDIDGFNKNSSKIVSLIPDDTKYIVCSCDSCYETLKKIPEINSKIIRIDEILKENNYEIPFNNKAIYHKPLTRKDECYLPEVKIINKKGSCSLMENYFLLKHKKITKTILENNFYNEAEINNKILVTSCQLSAYGLKWCINKKKYNTKLYTYSEYVNLLTENS